MPYLIYKHTNKINGKSYIGLTHFSSANIRWQNGKGYNKHTQPCFRDAIKKYGWENFTHEILEDNIKTKSEANLREQYWIAYYHTYVKDPLCNGYNLTKGGDDHTYTAKSVLQLAEDKSILQRFESLSLAEDATGIYAKNIYKACSKKIKSAGGYYWCYAEDYGTFTIQKSPRLLAVIPVYQLDEQKNILAEYPTVTEAAQAVNGHPSKISQCCSGKRCTAFGYYWCTKDNYNSYTIKKPYEQPYNARAVIQLEPASLNFIAEYSSAAEAGRAIGVINAHNTNIVRSCKDQKHKKQALGYVWMYREDYYNEKRQS